MDFNEKNPRFEENMKDELQQKVNALQKSEAKFKAYMEKSPLGIFVTDHEGRYTGVNREACQMSGYTEPELLNLSIADFIAPEFLEKGLKIFERFQKEGYAEEDIMVRKKNGETFWINFAAVWIDHQAVAFCQDITERKEKEERIKELNCLHNFSLLLQKENNDLEKIMEETVKLLPPSFQFPEDVGACITYKGREFKTQNYQPTHWKITSHLTLNDEQTGTIEVCYHKPPVHEQDAFLKEEKLMLGTIAEHLSRVIEQIQAEEDLQKSKNLLSTTLYSIGDGVIVTDAHGKITRLNLQAEKLTGWMTEEALGRDVSEVFHIVNANTGEPVPNPVYNVINSGRTHSLTNNTMLVARAGTKCHIADSAAPIRDDEENLMGVVMVFSDVNDRKYAEESLKYQFRFEKMLADISSVFATQSSDQLEQSINYALEQVGKFFQVERSYVFQFSDDGKQVSNTYEWCAEGAETLMDTLQNIPIEAFPWWAQQIINKKNVIIPDVDSLPPEAEAVKKLLKSQAVRSLLSIPMINNGIVFGFLGIDALKEKNNWTENQVMLLTVVTELTSNTYSKNMIEEKVHYNSLHDSLTGLYNRFFLENEMERLDTERQLPIGIMMFDLNGFKMVNDTFGHDVGDEMLKQTAEIFRNSFRREDLIARWGGDEFVIFLPQITEEDVKAICQRIDEKCKKYVVKDIPISMAMGYAIKDTANKDLAEMLKEAEENMYKHKSAESQRAKSTVLNVRLNKLESKIFETEAHYSIMQNVAHRIGKKKGLSQSELEKLNKLISMHDIGKIKIPEEILTKKGPLTAKEWKIVKKHPETGYMIARATEEFAQVAEDILSHREHWDGSGYPQGLKGNEIPLLARITAIADAYEVMSAGRAYKKALPKRDVITELKRCAGSQFDPELIEIFLHFLEQELKESDLTRPSS